MVRLLQHSIALDSTFLTFPFFSKIKTRKRKLPIVFTDLDNSFRMSSESSSFEESSDRDESEQEEVEQYFDDEAELDDDESDDEGNQLDDDDDDDDDDDEPQIVEEDDDDNIISPSSEMIATKIIVPEGIEKCSFDLHHLLAINSHQINSEALYPSSSKAITMNNNFIPNEEFLLQKSSEGCQQLIAAIWNLSTETSSNAGPLAVLPPSSELIHLPRAQPPPKPKAETKWEKFAKLRGIQPKAKRERKVYDEITGEWKYRYGYDRANKEDSKDKEWPIMEVKRGDDPFSDPWEKIRDAKRSRVEKNLESRMLNQERAGLLSRGSTKKTMKSRTVSRQQGKDGGGAAALLPKGIPIDLKNAEKGTAGAVMTNGRKRGKELTHAALLATQRSTASLGKFDRMLEGEPERKAPVRKRKFDIATASSSSNEVAKGMKVLHTVLNGGAKRDKAKRDGSLAKGETAYDYDFDDGLGPGSFKKKKGRAGSGKIRKVTKKRIK